MILFKKILNKLGFRSTYSLQKNGHLTKIPIFNDLGFANLQNAEPWMYQLLKQLGSNEALLLDVGVNVGQSLISWKSAFPDGKYIGFVSRANIFTAYREMLNELSDH